MSLSPQVVNKGGDFLAEHPVAVSAIPSDVVEASGGRVRCVGSGDSTISLTGGGVSTNTTIKCLLVAELKSSKKSLSLIVGTDGVAVGVTALDGDGATMEGVVVDSRVKDKSVASVRKGVVEGKKVGRTVLVLTAGDVSTEVPVEVIRKVKSDNIALSDGQSSTQVLDRGFYQVEVNVKSGSSKYGVTASWVGEDCKGHSESQQFTTRCNVSDTVSLVLENPSTFGMGPAAMGNISIYEVPQP